MRGLRTLGVCSVIGHLQPHSAEKGPKPTTCIHPLPVAYLQIDSVSTKKGNEGRTGCTTGGRLDEDLSVVPQPQPESLRAWNGNPYRFPMVAMMLVPAGESPLRRR